jgi:hypothetical protein
MNFNSLPEEQQHPELIRRLQQMYQMLPEDRESLLRIQARLSEAAFVLIKGKSQTTVISRPAETYQSTATHTLLGHGTLLNSGINGGGVHMITEQVG